MIFSFDFSDKWSIHRWSRLRFHQCLQSFPFGFVFPLTWWQRRIGSADCLLLDFSPLFFFHFSSSLQKLRFLLLWCACAKHPLFLFLSLSPCACVCMCVARFSEERRICLRVWVCDMREWTCLYNIDEFPRVPDSSFGHLSWKCTDSAFGSTHILVEPIDVILLGKFCLFKRVMTCAFALLPLFVFICMNWIWAGRAFWPFQARTVVSFSLSLSLSYLSYLSYLCDRIWRSRFKPLFFFVPFCHPGLAKRSLFLLHVFFYSFFCVWYETNGQIRRKYPPPGRVVFSLLLFSCWLSIAMIQSILFSLITRRKIFCVIRVMISFIRIPLFSRSKRNLSFKKYFLVPHKKKNWVTNKEMKCFPLFLKRHLCGEEEIEWFFDYCYYNAFLFIVYTVVQFDCLLYNKEFDRRSFLVRSGGTRDGHGLFLKQIMSSCCNSFPFFWLFSNVNDSPTKLPRHLKKKTNIEEESPPALRCLFLAHLEWCLLSWKNSIHPCQMKYFSFVLHFISFGFIFLFFRIFLEIK